MFSFLFPLVPTSLACKGFIFSFRSNYRLRERMWWVEMKGQIFFTSWDCDSQEDHRSVA